jgi:polar amino acid transport system substrate-binding protein
MTSRLLKCLLISAVLTIATRDALAADVLRVGTTPSGPPFTFVNPATQQSEGFMVDLIKAIAKDNHLQIEIVPMQFATLVPALTSSKLDVISAAMSPTDARRKVIDFSDPVYRYGEGAIIRATDSTDYTSIQEMKGFRAGAVVGTSYYDVMKGSGAFKEVLPYDDAADMLSDLQAGRIDVMFADGPILKYHFAHNEYPKLRYLLNYKSIVHNAGSSIAVRKDETDLLDKINASIRRMKADGELDALIRRWGL